MTLINDYPMYNDPIMIKYRSNTSDDPYIPITESRKIVNNQTVLTEIPVEFNHVVITGYLELYEGVPTSNQFIVNYSNGVITFNPSEAGKTVTCTYMGKGQILYPAERIYAHNDNPDVVQTLQEIIDSGEEARDALNQLNDKIDEANVAISGANTAAGNANTKGAYAQTQGDYAKSSGDALVFKGDYASGTAYVPKNMVYFNGATYMNILASTGIDPTNSTRWKRLGGLIWKGTYSTATTYMFGDTVVDSTLYIVYISVKDTNLNNALTNTTYWAKLIDVTSVVNAMTTATTNATTATTNAQAATTAATTAATSANTAATATTTAITNAQAATTAANTAKTNADNATAAATAAAALAGSFVSKGSYSATTSYSVNNVVEYNGSGYINIAASTGIAPTNTANWKLIVAQGSQGIQGATGATGTGFAWKGVYASGTTYAIRDIVSYNGNTYLCKSTTTGNVPTNTTFWDLFASKGNDGAGSVANITSANADLIIGGTVATPDLAINSSLKTLWADKYTKAEVNSMLTTGYMPLNNQTIKTSGNNPRFELIETDSTLTGNEGIRIAADGNTYFFLQTIDLTGVYQRDLMTINRQTAAVNFYGAMTVSANLVITPQTTAPASTPSRRLIFSITDASSVVTTSNAIQSDSSGNLTFQNNAFVAKMTMTQAGAITTPTATFDDGSGNSIYRTIRSTVATGTAPMIIASTTQVLNLNASLLAGAAYDSAVANANTVVGRDSNGDIIARRLTLTLASGSAPMTVTSRIVVTNLNADLLDGLDGSAYALVASPVFTGTITTPTANVTASTGTSPFIVASTTLVSNLNVDMVDNYHASTASAVNTIVVRDGSQNINVADVYVGTNGRITSSSAMGSGAQGGTLQQTADTTNGYGLWECVNCYYHPTNGWIQIRGDQPSRAHSVTMQNGRRFHYAAPTGTNGSAITWTVVSIEDQNGLTVPKITTTGASTFAGDITLNARIFMEVNGAGASQSSKPIYFYATDASSVKTTNNYIVAGSDNELYYSKAGVSNKVLTSAGGSVSGKLTVSTAGFGLETSGTGTSGLLMTNTTASTGRKYSIYSDNSGRMIIGDETAVSQRLIIDNTGKATFIGNVTAKSLTVGTDDSSISDVRSMINETDARATVLFRTNSSNTLVSGIMEYDPNVQGVDTLNFVGKIAGSNVVNPNISKRTNGTVLLAPSAFGATELTDTVNYMGYPYLATLDANYNATSSLINGQMAQQLFSFDLISYIERKLGFAIGNTTADKISWLKANVIGLTCNWYGYGSGPAGNKASLTFWCPPESVGSTRNQWNVSSIPVTNNGTVTKLSLVCASTNPLFASTPSNMIDANGFTHFIAYADASNGTIASALNTDYVELVVTLNFNIMRGTSIIRDTNGIATSIVEKCNGKTITSTINRDSQGKISSCTKVLT